MQRLQAFKFELRPNGQQQRQMRSFAGACRFVFNKALALQKTNYETGGKFIGYLEPLASFKRHETRLRRYQRAMSRKVKFSRNWHKAKRKVQATHTRIANARRDYLHKDQGWFEFRRQLEYKLAWTGGHLIAVDPRNTSRTCPCCGSISADNRKTQAVFRCVVCGHQAHADVVGAINILARGHRAAACGEDVSRAKPAKAQRATSVKQEPTEAITGALDALA